MGNANITNTVSNNLLQTMKVFAEYAKTTSDGALIVEATIVDIIDEGVGEYSVEYFGNTFSVYSNNRDLVYSVGDNVYISVPERDFSKNKIIIGLSNPKDAVFTNNDIQTIYNEVSDNLITNNLGIIELCSYAGDTSGETYVTECPPAEYAKILNNYNTFALKCKVKTSLLTEQQNSGVYGFTLYLPLVVNAATGEGITDIEWKGFNLDTTNMLGNFYRFEEWTSQTVYFTLDNQYKISSDYSPVITYYCYGFIKDETKTDKDIFIKDISLYAVEEITTEDESGYGLTLKASEGPYFGAYFTNTKIITPTLRYNKRPVKLTENNCEVYWFKECVDVRGDSEYYNTYGGYGWKCLNAKANVAMNPDGTQSFTWVTSELTKEIKRTDVSISTHYKCVIIYKQTKIAAMITLKDLDTNRIFELNTIDGNNVLIKDTGYAHLVTSVYIEGITDKDEYKNSITYSWMRYNKDGEYIKDPYSFFEIVRFNERINDRYETEIKFPVYQIEEVNYVYCSATYLNEDLDKELVGTRSIALFTSELFEYNLNITNDDLIYKYDANGDSPAGTAYDGPGTSKVTEIAPLNYTIRTADGNELSAEEYCYVHYMWMVPKNSLFSIVGTPTREDSNYYYFEGYDNYNHTAANLMYKIANRFNLTKANAAIILQVKFKDITLTETASISFIKEGMNGTNGTAYSARLVYGGGSASSSVPYGKLNENGEAVKLKFVYVTSDNSLWYYNFNDKTLHSWDEEKKRIYIQVFENSEELAFWRDFLVEYNMFDENFTNPCFGIGSVEGDSVILRLKETPDKANYPCNILQAKVIVKRTNSSISNSEEIIYAYYPIELTIVNTKLDIIPTIEGGFAEVMYASDGTNPSWDQTAPFRLEENQKLNIANYYNISWVAQNHISPHSASDKEVSFEPDNKYDDGDSKNYVAITANFKVDMRESIEDTIQSLEIDKASQLEEKVAAAKNLNYLQDFANYFTYDGWMDVLDQIKPTLDIQTNMVYNLKVLQSASAALKEYIQTQIEYSSLPIETTCAELIEEEENLKEFTEQAIIQTQHLNGIAPYSFDDLISLESYRLTWNSEIKNTYIQELGLNTAISFEVLIENINQTINNYQIYYNQIDTLTNRSNINIYRNLVEDIENTCSYIEDDAYPQYIDLRDKTLAYLDKFNECTSIKDLKNYIGLMHLDVLNTVFVLQEGLLHLKQYVIDELNNKQIKCQEKYDEDVKLIENLNAILATENIEIFHIRPIVIYFNRYEMSNINAWDGNKLETGDGNYLLAPQVGAGIKDESNSFTGLIMGQRILGASVGTSNSSQVGLFGYSKGRQSVFINADTGSAIFGVAGNGGQIVVDPATSGNSRSLLYSSNYWDTYNNKTGLPTNYTDANKKYQGICIDLKQGDIHLGNETSKIYSGKHDILSKSETGFYLSHDGLSIGSQVKIDSSGVMLLGKGAVLGNGTYWTIDGSDDATRSYIAHGTTSFNTGNNSVYLGTDGISLGTNKFMVTNEGELTSKAGHIGGIKITTSSIESENFSQNTGFQINADGSAIFRNIHVTGYVTTSEFEAEKIRVNTLLAEKATIEELNAVKIDVRNLTVEYGEFKSATINNLTVLNELSVKTITTDNMAVKVRLDASQIVSGTVSADRLSADTIYTKFLNACAVSPFQGIMYMGNGYFGNLYTFNGSEYKRVLYEGSNSYVTHGRYDIVASGTDAQGRPVSISGSVTI